MTRVTNIPTRFALVKRAEKILADIDKYFEDADAFGLSVAEADPNNTLVNIRKGLIAMLENEKRIRSKGAAR